MVMLDSAAGPVVVALATGDTRPAESDEAFMCQQTGKFGYLKPFRYGGGSTNSRHGGDLYFVCDADAEPSDALVTTSMASVAEARFDHIVVTSTPEGVLAYRD